MLFAAGILGFVFVGELEDSVRSSLEKSLKENYGVPGKESITNSWNSVQQNVSITSSIILFFLARLHEVQNSYCSHPGRKRSRSCYRSRSRHTLLKFSRSLYLDNQLSESIHTWTIGTL